MSMFVFFKRHKLYHKFGAVYKNRGGYLEDDLTLKNQLIINNEVQNFNENFFYNYWEEIKIENQLINFILPLEDLEDISKIVEMKNRIEEVNVESFVNKYDIKNYVFALIDYQDSKLNIHFKTNFDNNKISRNISYKLKNINDKTLLNSILKDFNLKINDIWKEENLINLLMPLSIKIRFEQNNIKELVDLLHSEAKVI